MAAITAAAAMLVVAVTAKTSDFHKFIVEEAH
jgi:hypothetical protein